MKFHSLRRSLIASVFAFMTAALVASCGGGGAAQTLQGGALVLLPATGTIYAGVPTTFTIVGGRGPYTLTSSEPQLLSVPSTVNGNSFTIVAANPGVVDVGLDPLAVPSRTVTITMRDTATTVVVTGIYNVLQNFLTGYGVTFSANSCPPTAATTTAANSVCAGGEIAVQFAATFAGNLAGDREFRLEVIRGPFFWVHPTTGIVGNSVTVRSDHSGQVSAIMRVAANVPTQLAVLRVIDVATGVFTDITFVINGANSDAILTPIPDTFSFTGPDTQTCGTGQADFFVFDGLPPYAAASSNPNVVVTAISPNTNPGVFRIQAINPNVCLTNATIVITDALGARGTVTVTTAAGANPPPAPPPPALSVVPSTITLGCGQSGSVSIVGGAPGATRSASSANPNVAAVVLTNTLTITRAGPAGPGSVAQTTSQVNVTDGTSVATVTVTSPTICPGP